MNKKINDGKTLCCGVRPYNGVRMFVVKSELETGAIDYKFARRVPHCHIAIAVAITCTPRARRVWVSKPLNNEWEWLGDNGCGWKLAEDNRKGVK